MSTTDNTLKKVFLIKVEPGANNNKYYNFTELGDGTFKAEYGRVGGHMATEIYPMSKWDSKYKEKLSLRKGYEDKTHLFLEEIKKDNSKSTIAEITDKVVHKLVTDLQKFAKVSVETNYIVSSSNVTQPMIDEAQVLVNEITHLTNIGQETEPMNKLLVDLFKVIPRKMAHVKDYLFEGTVIKTKNDLEAAQGIVHKEQETLDVMAGQVSTNDKLDIGEAKPTATNILEVMGLIIMEAPDSDIPMIKDLMQQNKNQFRKAYIVINKRTQERFDKNLIQAGNKKLELFWHGSRNENWWSILDKGLMIRPANAILTGAMFGKSLYFAQLFKKSYGYTSGRGSYWAKGSDNVAFLTLNQVHVGEQLKIKHHESWCYDLTYQNLKKRGSYDSLWAVGGADLINDEFMVYTEPQATVKYLIEVNG